MESVQQQISDAWDSVVSWIEENPKVSAGIGCCATVWAISELRAIHQAYTIDDEEESTNLEYARARRKSLLSIKVNCPKNIQLDEEYVEMNDGIMLFTRTYIPKDKEKMKGMICFNHGYGDYLDCLIHDTGLEFAKRGFIVFMHEHFGHGRSDGLYVYCPDFKIYVRHASYLHKRAKLKYSKLYNIPKNGYFIGGESLGGAVSIRESLYDNENRIKNESKNDENEFDWNGMFLVAPLCGVNPSVRPPKFIEKIGLDFITPLVPTMAKAPTGNFDPHLLSDDAPQSVREKFFNDKTNPLKIEGFKPRFITAKENINTGDYIQQNAKKVTIPLIAVHSKLDKITDPQQSKVFVENVSSKEKQFIMYDRGYHVILHDCISNQVYNDLESWIMKRMQSA